MCACPPLASSSSADRAGGPGPCVYRSGCLGDLLLGGAAGYRPRAQLFAWHTVRESRGDSRKTFTGLDAGRSGRSACGGSTAGGLPDAHDMDRQWSTAVPGSSECPAGEATFIQQRPRRARRSRGAPRRLAGPSLASSRDATGRLALPWTHVRLIRLRVGLPAIRCARGSHAPMVRRDRSPVRRPAEPEACRSARPAPSTGWPARPSCRSGDSWSGVQRPLSDAAGRRARLPRRLHVSPAGWEIPTTASGTSGPVP
jgi:hypothetical protein